MNRLFAGLWASSLLLLLSGVPPIQAQTETRPGGIFHYNASQETTGNGTVSTVLLKHEAGSLSGSHLLLSTVSGPLDAILGRFAFVGKGALQVRVGQQVEVTGVVKTIMDKRVLLVRTVKASGEVYTIRNEHGALLSPRARASANRSAGEGL